MGIAFILRGKMTNQYLPGVIQTPSALEITAMNNAYPMTVTVSADPISQSNTYIEGQLVRLTIPFNYGMQQANGAIYKILSNDGTNIVLDVDSRKFDPFSVPVSGEMPASLAPYGSRNVEYSNNTNTLAFQSLNNIGN